MKKKGKIYNWRSTPLPGPRRRDEGREGGGEERGRLGFEEKSSERREG